MEFFMLSSACQSYGGVKVEFHSFSASTLEGDGLFHVPGSFTYAQIPRYRLGGPQSWSQLFGEGKNHLSVPEIKASFCGRPAFTYVFSYLLTN
jgi:hypothetical protein